MEKRKKVLELTKINNIRLRKKTAYKNRTKNKNLCYNN